MDRLKGKIVVVTGSTRGIGRDIAESCAAEGAAGVVVSGRSERDGESAARAIGERYPGTDTVFIRCDVSDTDDCARLIDAAAERFGRIDGLVNNAGIFPDCPLEGTDRELFDRVVATDVRGAFFCTQQAVKYMKERGGSIVNIGSTHWAMGGGGLCVYAMSKGALHTLTRHVAHHYAKYRIRSNFVVVGWVMSDGEKEKDASIGLTGERLREMEKRAIPFGRFQTGRDIANTCVFLLSDEASEVTDTDISVTGGFKPERNG